MDGGVELGIEGLGPGTEIGSGGFGTVYLATETDFGRPVAVKILQNLDDAGRRRFDRERLSMGRLHEHPNVVTPYRSGYTDRGWPFLVMEYLEGGSLAEAIDRAGPMAWEQASGYVIPVADALGHGHLLGILHRDVKPENILLTRTGVPKLTDFGIAVVRERTATASLGYSIAHAPPETFSGGRDERDERSDLYSLASTMYTLVVGHGPYHLDDEVADSQLAYIVRIAQEPIPALGRDPRYDHFLRRALAKDPADRPATASQFIDELRATLTPGTGPVGPVPAPPAPSTVVTPPTDTPANPTVPIGAPAPGSAEPPTPLTPPASAPSSSAPLAFPPPTTPPNSTPSGLAPPDSVAPDAAPPTASPSGLAPPGSAAPGSVRPGFPPPSADGAIGFAPPTPADAHGAGDPFRPITDRPDDRPARRTGLLVAAVAVVALLVAGAVGFALTRDDGDGSDDVAAEDEADPADADTGTADTPDQAGADDEAGEGDDGPGGDSGTAGDSTPDEGDDAPSTGPVDAIDSELRIGGLMPLTGVVSFLEPSMTAGAELAIADINAAGGVFGSDVVWLPEDSGGLDVPANEAVGRLLDQDVHAVVGAALSSVTLAVIDRITDAGVIQISATNTSAELTTYDDDGLYFRTAPSDLVQGSALAQAVIDDGHQTLAMLVIDEPYGITLAEAAGAWFDAIGGTVEQIIPYDPSRSDFGAEVTALVQSGADAVAIIGFSETGQIIEELHRQGIGPTSSTAVYGVDGNVSDALAFEVSDPSILAGMRGTRAGVDIEGELPDFAARVRGVDPGLASLDFSAETYDAVVVVALAAIAANSDDPRQIAGRMADVTDGGATCFSFADCAELLANGVDIDYDGPSGPLSFTPAGDPGRGSFLILEFDQRGQTFVDRTVVAQHP